MTDLSSLGNLVGLGTNTELQEAEPFLAVICIDEPSPDQFGESPDSKVWHLGYRPVRFKLNGVTGCFHEYLRPSFKSHSKIGAVLAGLKRCNINANQVAQGKLIGQAAWVVKTKLTFKGNSGTNETEVMVPIRAVTEQEQDEANRLPPLNESAGVSVPREMEFEWTEERINEALSILDNATKVDVVKNSNRVSPELRAQLVSGQAAQYLQDLGRLEFTNKVYHVVEY